VTQDFESKQDRLNTPSFQGTFSMTTLRSKPGQNNRGASAAKPNPFRKEKVVSWRGALAEGRHENAGY
jgi:hypothetical protein